MSKALDSLARLARGYAQFQATTYPENRTLYQELFERGQAPETMVIACCDSRADPAIIFDAQPGELFVVRNVANLVPPYEPHGDYHGTSAALEFAVTSLAVRNIVVLGHAKCGGIRAFLEGTFDPAASGAFIGKWMGIMKVARGEVLAQTRGQSSAERQRALELASIVTSLENLATFPFVRAAVEAGRLHLHGAYFSIASGQLTVYRPEQGDFVPFADAVAAATAAESEDGAA